jgi:hypothetical protein
LGWCAILKATLYLLFPRLGMSSLSRVTRERAWMFGVAGWVCVALSAVISYSVLAGR